MNYDSVNKVSWESHVKHLLETEYKGKNLVHSLNPIEQTFTKDIAGKKILHLFCNFGMNTFSLESKSNTPVTGVDFSQTAINFANKYKKTNNLKSNFICTNYKDYNPNEKFDIVFCSFGVLDWIENFELFIKKVKSLLVEGGKFIIIEFHTDYFEKIIQHYNGIHIEKNIYKITKEINVYDSSQKSILGKTIITKKNIDFYTKLFNTNDFLNQLKKKMKIEEYHEFDYTNYPITTDDKKIEKFMYRNDTLEKNQKMAFGLTCRNYG